MQAGAPCGVGGAGVMAGEAQAWLDVSEDASSLMLRPQGDWVVRHAETLDKSLQAVDAFQKRAATFDLSHLSKLDTAGAWLVYRTARTLERAGSQVTIAGATAAQSTLLNAVAKADKPVKVEPRVGNIFSNLIVRMGHALEEGALTGRDLVAFFGLVLETLGKSILNPFRMRVTSTAYHMEQTGLNAVPIVSLISFLIGAVLASLALFLCGGSIVWAAGFAMGAGQVLGARIGASLVISHGTRLVRLLLITVSVLITLKVLSQGFSGQPSTAADLQQSTSGLALQVVRVVICQALAWLRMFELPTEVPI